MADMKFEEALSRLERIVEKLEGEELSLEDSLKSFQEGIRLTRICTKKLNEAEGKIEVLLRDEEGREKTEPLDPEAAAE